MIQAWKWLDYTASGRLVLAFFYLASAITLAEIRPSWMVYILFMLAGANFAYSTNPPKSQ